MESDDLFWHHHFVLVIPKSVTMTDIWAIWIILLLLYSLEKYHCC